MKILGGAIIILSIIAALYIGLWLMFIQPIMYACACFDAGILTGTIFGITVLKCVFASAVGSLILYGGCALGFAVGDF